MPLATIATIIALCTGCMELDAERQYDSSLHTLHVTALYPAGFESYATEGTEFVAMDDNMGRSYTAKAVVADAEKGMIAADFRLSEGLYNVAVSDARGRYTFNASADQVRLASGDVAIELRLAESLASPLIIKEIYCGGCTKLPFEGTYAVDKYIVLHNNSAETYYLDGLCIGVIEPYNSTAANVWIERDETTGETVFPDFLPIGECIWQFSGNGSDFPIEKGEDVVVAINGAINHTAQYPNSVNLENADFVCYAPVFYGNTTYHPAPSDKIPTSHYLNVVVKVGPANGYPFSQTSPGVILFRAQECTIQEFVAREGVIVQKPGSTIISVVKIPRAWAIDAVEVFDGTSSQNRKRFASSLDAGYVYLSNTYLGHSLMRHYDEQASAEAGFAIYVDTNNSTNDFYERDKASLKDNE